MTEPPHGGAAQLELALQTAPAEPLDLLIWREGGGAELPGLQPWSAGPWPGPWAAAAWHRGDVEGQRVVCVTAPSLPPDAGWITGLPVWWAAARGARTLLVLNEGRSTGRSPHPAGVVHATDHLDLTASSPLIGLGSSTRGPLFPDRTGVLHPDLVPAAERALASVAGVVACLPAEGAGLAASGLDALDLEADATTRGAATPLAAAAHVGLPSLLLVRVQPDALFAEDAPTLLPSLLASMPERAS